VDGVEEEEEKYSSPSFSFSELPGFTEEDLEGDFDPDAFEKQMAAIFDDDYYAEEDEAYPYNPDEDDELQGLAPQTYGTYGEDEEDQGWTGDVGEGEEGEDEGISVSIIERPEDLKKQKKEARGPSRGEVSIEYGESDVKESEQRNLDRLLEEYYNLDYEDLVSRTQSLSLHFCSVLSTH
jgi:protein KRI1